MDKEVLDSVKKWSYTLIAIIFLFLMYYFFKTKIPSSTGLSFPLKDLDNLKYLLSAEIQSLAAILAIIFAILILGTQMNYQLYSPKFGYKFLSLEYLIYYFVYGMTIIYDLIALWMIPEWENEAIQQNFISSVGDASILFMILCLAILPTFILSTIKRLLPTAMFNDAVDSAKDEKRITEVQEFLFLSIVSALNRSDYVAVEDGVKSILKILERKKRIEELTETLEDIYDEMERPFPKKRYIIIIKDFFDKNLDKDYLPILYSRWRSWISPEKRDNLWKLIIDVWSLEDICRNQLEEQLFNYSINYDYEIEKTFDLYYIKKVKISNVDVEVFDDANSLLKRAIERNRMSIDWVINKSPKLWETYFKPFCLAYQRIPNHEGKVHFKKYLRGNIDELYSNRYLCWQDMKAFEKFQSIIRNIYEKYFGSFDDLNRI